MCRGGDRRVTLEGEVCEGAVQRPHTEVALEPRTTALLRAPTCMRTATRSACCGYRWLSAWQMLRHQGGDVQRTGGIHNKPRGAPPAKATAWNAGKNTRTPSHQPACKQTKHCIPVHGGDHACTVQLLLHARHAAIQCRRKVEHMLQQNGSAAGPQLHVSAWCTACPAEVSAAKSCLLMSTNSDARTPTSAVRHSTPRPSSTAHLRMLQVLAVALLQLAPHSVRHRLDFGGSRCCPRQCGAAGQALDKGIKGGSLRLHCGRQVGRPGCLGLVAGRECQLHHSQRNTAAGTRWPTASLPAIAGMRRNANRWRQRRRQRRRRRLPHLRRSTEELPASASSSFSSRASK